MKSHIFMIRWENHVRFKNKFQIDNKETTADRFF